MFIQVNDRPLNIFQVVYFYSRDSKDREGTLKYMLYYRLTDGRVLEEEFSDVSERDTKLDELNAIQLSGGGGGGITPAKKSVIQKPTKDDFPSTGDTSTLYIAKDEEAIYYYDSASTKYIKASSTSSGGTSITEYAKNTDYKQGALLYCYDANKQNHLFTTTKDFKSSNITGIDFKSVQEDIDLGNIIEISNTYGKLDEYQVDTHYSKYQVIMFNKEFYYTLLDFTSSNIKATPGTTEDTKELSITEDIKNNKLTPICNSSSGDAQLQREIISNVKCGAADAGTLFEKNMQFTEFAEKLLLAEVHPTTQFTASNSEVIHEKGTQVTSTLTLKITSQGTCKIKSIEFISAGVSVDKQNYVDGTNTYSYTLSDKLSNDTLVMCKVYYTTSTNVDKTQQYTKQYKFRYKSYSLLTSGVPTVSDIQQSSGNLYDTKGTTITVSPNNQHIVYAYPQSYGNLTSIKDGNNFEYISSYTKIVLTIPQADGQNVSYNVYYLTDLVTGTDIKQIYK